MPLHLGLGCNTALETVQYLAAALESFPDDQVGAMKYFDEVRRPQVQAAGRLSEAGFGGVKKRTQNFLFSAKVGALVMLNKAGGSLRISIRPTLTLLLLLIRAFVLTFTVKVSHAPISVECFISLTLLPK